MMVIASAIAAIVLLAMGQAARDIRSNDRPALAVASIILGGVILFGVFLWFMFATGVFAFTD
jgi:hypothetical protein